MSEESEIKAVLRQLWREYKQYLKRTQAAPHFIEERRVLVESVLKEKPRG